jgi:serine/threonine protein kinase
MPHGNLKGVSHITAGRCLPYWSSSSLTPYPQTNVLVGELGQVRLTDYGFAPITSAITFTATGCTAGNARWLAPEIIKPPPGMDCMVVESMPADIFAFAMLSIEVFTGRPPFGPLGNPGAAIQILRGGRPGFPQNTGDVHLTRKMREFLQGCWHQNPMERPEIDEVVTTWGNLLGDNEYVLRTSNDQSCG